jgi:uncharacterized protein (TIGR00290 family)
LTQNPVTAKNNAIFNWSGGKDSSFALYRVLNNQDYNIKYLLASVNAHYNRLSMHGVRIELIEQQAASIGLPLRLLQLPEMPSMEDYNREMAGIMQGFKDEGINYSIFGDIFLEDLKTYREQQLAKVNMQGVFPIWKSDTTALVKEFIELGFKAMLICVNERHLDKSFAGRLIDEDFLKDLPANVDPCGENGEYHSFVFDGPIFKTPIDFKMGEIVYRKYEQERSNNFDTGFFYLDLLPGSN